jgi:hypothetical protein
MVSGAEWAVEFIKKDNFGNPVINDGQVTLYGNPPFLVCSDKCRKHCELSASMRDAS